MDVWWGGLLPSPEDFNKDPRIEQLADLKRQLEAANKVVASLTPRSAQKGTSPPTLSVYFGHPQPPWGVCHITVTELLTLEVPHKIEFSPPSFTPLPLILFLLPYPLARTAGAGITGRVLFPDDEVIGGGEGALAAATSANPILASLQLDGKTALVVGDHHEVVKSLSRSLASLGAGVAEGTLDGAVAGTWVKAVARATNKPGEVTRVDDFHDEEALKSPSSHASKATTTASAMAAARTGVDVAVVVASSTSSSSTPGDRTGASAAAAGGWGECVAALQSQIGAARAVIQAVAPGMRMRRWGRVLIVSVGSPGTEGAAALFGSFNSLAATWAADLGGQGVTCNSLNVKVQGELSSSSSSSGGSSGSGNSHIYSNTTRAGGGSSGASSAGAGAAAKGGGAAAAATVNTSHECFVGPAMMLVGPAGAGVNGAALPVHARRV